MPSKRTWRSILFVASAASAFALVALLCLGLFTDMNVRWYGWALGILAGATAVCVCGTLLLPRELGAAGRHTCKRCGYDLRFNISSRCPECGRRIPIFSQADERVLAALRGRDVREPEPVYIAPEDTVVAPLPAERQPTQRLRRRLKAIRGLRARSEKTHS